ncbi:MAG: hypothetical protein AAF639_11705 [Chloroflexota bacterium]
MQEIQDETKTTISVALDNAACKVLLQHTKEDEIGDFLSQFLLDYEEYLAMQKRMKQITQDLHQVVNKLDMINYTINYRSLDADSNVLFMNGQSDHERQPPELFDIAQFIQTPSFSRNGHMHQNTDNDVDLDVELRKKAFFDFVENNKIIVFCLQQP